MTTTQLIIWGVCLVIFAWVSGLGLGLFLMGKRKDKEISELVRKIAENEQTRRKQADNYRLLSLDYSNLKHRIRKILKQYGRKSSKITSELSEVIDE